MEKIIEGKRANSNWLRKFGCLLDLNTRTFREFEKLLGITFGVWKPLPQPEYMLVFKTMYVKCEACNPEDFEDDTKGTYQLSIVHHKNRKLIVHESNNKAEVFALAEKLAHEFHVPIRDAASNRRKAVWMK